MNRLISTSLIFILFLAVGISNITMAESVSQNTKGRLITIYDRGNERLIVSTSETVKDVLNEANVIINDKDIVEPSIDTVLMASDYHINIYRARPVTIIDGSIKQRVFTAYQTAKQIVLDAGIKVFDEDKINLSLSDFSSGAGLELIINRAKQIEFTAYGKTDTYRTHVNTVEDFLAEKNIKLEQSDKMSVENSTILSDGMKIRLWREGKQTITVEEKIEFTTEYIEDADQSVDYSAIKSAGQLGKRNVTYELVIEDDKEVSRREIASLTTQAPIKQVETIGVKGKYTTPLENENIAWDFLISNGFSRVQTAGIMGNLMQEHRFRTDGDGIAQWTGGRKAKLYSLPNPNNIYTQLQFMMDELNGGYSKVRDAILSTNSLTEATQIFQNQYEKCGVCREDLRLKYASDILASH